MKMINIGNATVPANTIQAIEVRDGGMIDLLWAITWIVVCTAPIFLFGHVAVSLGYLLPAFYLLYAVCGQRRDVIVRTPSKVHVVQTFRSLFWQAKDIDKDAKDLASALTTTIASDDHA
jgi:hypothetical protein